MCGAKLRLSLGEVFQSQIITVRWYFVELVPLWGEEMFSHAHSSPGARDRLWPSRLLGKLANFNFTRIIPGTLVVNAGVAVETLEWAVCSGRV